MKTLYRLLFLCFGMWLCAQSAFSQDYQWVDFYKGKKDDHIRDMVVDKKGNQYLVGHFLDSLHLGNKNYYNPRTQNAGIIFKQNDTGGIVWSGEITANSNTRIDLYGVTFASNGNLIVVGSSVADTIYFPGNKTLVHGLYGSIAFIAFFDTAGNVLEARVLFHKPNFQAYFDNIKFTNDAQDNLYFSFGMGSGFNAYDSGQKYTFSYNWDISNHVCKFSRSGAKLEWMKHFKWMYNSSDIDVDEHGNVYVGGTNVNYIFGTYSFAGKTIPNHPSGVQNAQLGILFSWDKSGNEKDFFCILPDSASGHNTNIVGLTVYDSNSVYLTGFIRSDSVKFGNKWAGKGYDSSYNYFGKFDIEGNVKWLKIADKSTTFQGTPGLTTIPVVNFLDSFIYMFVYQYGITSYDKQYYGGTGLGSMLMKFDNLGNILWGFRTHGYITGLGIDTLNGFYFAGDYNTSIQFGRFSSTSPAINTSDLFIGKTYDYSIHRGDVYQGPYCAGDTMYIPYIKYGVFDTSNYFIAELSDEWGNYTGGQRELGRLKTTDSGTIRGIIPLQYVPSSPYYRIRVRSTAPDAQSFYFRDSLHLLIYSRDSADAGPDLYMCLGNYVTLKTYGGTKWQWTPGSLVDDSNFRVTKARPTAATEFRIIISDSSGCGANDTDYVWVYMRQPLNISAPFTDTTICEGKAVTLLANTAGGDSLNHNIWWYEKTNGNYKLIDSGKVKQFSTKCTDSCAKLSRTTGLGKTVMAVLWDSCTVLRDTQYYRINVHDSVLITVADAKNKYVKFVDSNICYGQQMPIYSNGKGGTGKYYTHWFLQNGTPVGEGDSIILSPTTTTFYYAVITDSCNSRTDTGRFSLHVRSQLFSQLLDSNKSKYVSGDTTLCFGSDIKLTSIDFGGYPKQYEHTWIWNDTVYSKQKTTTLTVNKSDTTLLLIRVLSDNCTAKPDIDTIPIHILPKLGVVSTVPDTVCYKQGVPLTTTATGGTGNYTWQWYFEGQPLATQDSVWAVLSDLDSSGLKNITITVSDKCTRPNDSLIKQVFIRSPLDITVRDKTTGLTFTDSVICIGQAIDLYVEGAGGKPGAYYYRWYDGQQNLLHQGDEMSFTPTQNKNYFVVIGDSCTNKSDTAFFSIYLNPPLSGNIVSLSQTGGTFYNAPADTTLCYGNKIILGINGSGGDSTNYTYQWFRNDVQFSTSDSVTVNLTIGDTTEKIKLILTDNCTVLSDTDEITLNILPKLSLTASAPDTLCLGETQFAMATVSGGNTPGYTFTWNWDGVQAGLPHSVPNGKDSLSVPFISNPAPGAHSLAVKIEDGCTLPGDSTLFTVFVRDSLKISATIADTICFGQTINIQPNATGGIPANHVVSWYWNDTLVTQTPNFIIPPAGNGSLQGAVKAVLEDNCTAPQGQWVHTLTIRKPLEVTLAIDSTCVGNKAKLTATSTGGKAGSYNYTWFVDGVQVTANSTGVFQFSSDKAANIRVIADDNCSADDDTAEWTLQPLIPSINIDINPKVACEPATVTLTVTSLNTTKNTYQWSTRYNNDVIEVMGDTATYLYDKAGTYDGVLRVSTNNGCIKDFTLPQVVVNPRPFVDFTWNPLDVSLPNADAELINLGNSAHSYQWFMGDTLISSDYSTKYTFTDSGWKTLKLVGTNAYNCSDSVAKKLFIKDIVSVVIPSSFTPNGDFLNERFEIVTTGIDYYELQIFNRWGQHIFTGDMQHLWDGSYNGTPVTDGMYLYMIKLYANNKQRMFLNGVIHVMR